MLAVGGRTESACIIHAIVGPESEPGLDLHGCAVVDVTEIVRACPPGSRIVLKLTRCVSEPAAARNLASAGILAHGVHAPAKPHGPDIASITQRPAPVPGVCQGCGSITDTVMGRCGACAGTGERT